MSALKPDLEIIKLGLTCKCPKCKTGALYQSTLSMNLNKKCPHCGLDFSHVDSGDGPAVFLIFILGFALVPLALIVDAFFSWPLWLHTIIWGVLALALTIGSLRPLKAYIIALQYKHRASDFND